MRWFEKPAILDEIVEAYAGTTDRGKRQFIWQEENGDLVIGNTRAFTDHLRAKHGEGPSKTAWMQIHGLLRALGEVVQQHKPHVNKRGTRFINQEPEVHILRRHEEE